MASIFDGPREEPVQPARCVVRLKTSQWADERGISIKKTLSVMKKQSDVGNIFEESIHNIGAKETLEQIINLDECDDGLYEVDTRVSGVDPETGYADDFELTLKPLQN